MNQLAALGSTPYTRVTTPQRREFYLRAVIDEVLDEFGRAIAAKLATRLPPEWGEAADCEVADTVANIKAEIAVIFQGE